MYLYIYIYYTLTKKHVYIYIDRLHVGCFMFILTSMVKPIVDSYFEQIVGCYGEVVLISFGQPSHFSNGQSPLSRPSWEDQPEYWCLLCHFGRGWSLYVGKIHRSACPFFHRPKPPIGCLKKTLQNSGKLKYHRYLDVFSQPAKDAARKTNWLRSPYERGWWWLIKP